MLSALSQYHGSRQQAQGRFQCYVYYTTTQYIGTECMYSCDNRNPPGHRPKRSITNDFYYRQQHQHLTEVLYICDVDIIVTPFIELCAIVKATNPDWLHSNYQFVMSKCDAQQRCSCIVTSPTEIASYKRDGR